MSDKARDTRVKRDDIPGAVRIALWARTAGRCTICNRRLLGDSLTFWHSVAAAEMAHNIGATETPGSPRGIADKIQDREAEENLLLVCHDCHRIIDHNDHVQFFPPEKLRELKESHERRIEMATNEGGLIRTAVVRLGSRIKGSFSMASRYEVAETLFADNYLGLVESQWTGDFTCRLQGDETGRGFWLSAQDSIDASMRVVEQAVENGDVKHISVFAIAPIPTLVYLGSRLDDKVPARIFQKSRHAGWKWPTGASVAFHATFSVETSTAKDVVLICSFSAAVDSSRMPEELRSVPHVAVGPDDKIYSPARPFDEQSLIEFAATWRSMLAESEWRYPQAERWHLVAAVPVSLAVEIGRSFMRGVQPAVHVYQRVGQEYESVLTLGQHEQF